MRMELCWIFVIQDLAVQCTVCICHSVGRAWSRLSDRFVAVDTDQDEEEIEITRCAIDWVQWLRYIIALMRNDA